MIISRLTQIEFLIVVLWREEAVIAAPRITRSHLSDLVVVNFSTFLMEQRN
jgi:hypothetical protein